MTRGGVAVCLFSEDKILRCAQDDELTGRHSALWASLRRCAPRNDKLTGGLPRFARNDELTGRLPRFACNDELTGTLAAPASLAHRTQEAPRRSRRAPATGMTFPL